MHVHSSARERAYTDTPTRLRTRVRGRNAFGPDGAAQAAGRACLGFPPPPEVALALFVSRVGTFSLGVQHPPPGADSLIGETRSRQRTGRLGPGEP